MGLIPCNCPAPGSSIRGHRQQSFRAFAAFALKQRECKCAFVPRFTATPAGYDGPNGVTNGCVVWLCICNEFCCLLLYLLNSLYLWMLIMQLHVIITIILAYLIPEQVAGSVSVSACFLFRGDGQCPVVSCLLLHSL
jgi:hypothetical protein